MKRTLLLLCVLVISSTASSAQMLGIETAYFKNGASVGGAILRAPALVSDETFWFPTTGGTLLTTANFGGWLVGGQDLSALGLLGSTNSHDVSLIAGGIGNIRLTIMNSSAAVLLPAQTELRLGDETGGEYSSIKSPQTLPSNINYILPNYLPTRIGQRLQVEALSGSNITLGYTTEEVSTDVSFDTKTNFTETNAGPIDVADMAITVIANKTYAFEALISVQYTGAGCNASISFTLPVGASLHYYRVDLTDNNAAARGNKTQAAEVYDAPAAPNENHYILKGFVRTNGNGGVVQMRLATTNGGNTIRLTENSYMQITTN